MRPLGKIKRDELLDLLDDAEGFSWNSYYMTVPQLKEELERCRRKYWDSRPERDHKGKFVGRTASQVNEDLRAMPPVTLGYLGCAE